LQRIAQTRVSNPVVVGGDIHAFFANDLRVDFDDPKSPVVATEFVGTSVSASGPSYDTFAAFLPDNPHVQFFESRKRGYVSVDVDAGQMTTRLRAISDVTDPKASVSTLKTFAVENGKPGVVGA
jgi:alkaline phosphatase D